MPTHRSNSGAPSIRPLLPNGWEPQTPSCARALPLAAFGHRGEMPGAGCPSIRPLLPNGWEPQTPPCARALPLAAFGHRGEMPGAPSNRPLLPNGWERQTPPCVRALPLAASGRDALSRYEVQTRSSHPAPISRAVSRSVLSIVNRTHRPQHPNFLIPLQKFCAAVLHVDTHQKRKLIS